MLGHDPEEKKKKASQPKIMGIHVSLFWFFLRALRSSFLAGSGRTPCQGR